MFSDLMCVGLLLRLEFFSADRAFITGGMFELMAQQILLRLEYLPTVLTFPLSHLYFLLHFLFGDSSNGMISFDIRIE